MTEPFPSPDMLRAWAELKGGEGPSYIDSVAKKRKRKIIITGIEDEDAQEIFDKIEILLDQSGTISMTVDEE